MRSVEKSVTFELLKVLLRHKAMQGLSAYCVTILTLIIFEQCGDFMSFIFYLKVFRIVFKTMDLFHGHDMAIYHLMRIVFLSPLGWSVSGTEKCRKNAIISFTKSHKLYKAWQTYLGSEKRTDFIGRKILKHKQGEESRFDLTVLESFGIRFLSLSLLYTCKLKI